VEALAALLARRKLASAVDGDAVAAAVTSGAAWLIERVESGAWTQPAPIGFYFAKLWYLRAPLPQIFTVAALRRLAERVGEI